MWLRWLVNYTGLLDTLGLEGRYEKLLLKILRLTSDASIAFDDLRQLLLHLGFEERIKGSHHAFRKQGAEELINL